MKHLPRSRTLFILALSVVLLVNAFILIGVGYNRTGVAESTVVLTERELTMPYRWNKDEASVRINWRTVASNDKGYGRYSSLTWFDQEKLVSLGVDLSADSEQNYETHFIEFEAILVLEYDGEAYQQALKMAQQQVEHIEKRLVRLVDDKELLVDLKDAKEKLKNEKESASRLFVIDAGLNKEALRALYPDNQRYILANGIVDVNSNRLNGNNTPPIFTGRIDRLSVQYLHIERNIHEKLDKLRPSLNYLRNGNPPRFSLKVHYGRKLEPWVQASSFEPLRYRSIK